MISDGEGVKIEEKILVKDVISFITYIESRLLFNEADFPLNYPKNLKI